MKKWINRLSGAEAAVWLCLALACGAVGLAFTGASRSGAFMTRPIMLWGVGLLTALFCFVGLRALTRRRFDSLLLHLGCALVLGGWIWGRQVERAQKLEHPASGSMALVDGEESDRLWNGPRLDVFAGRVPFTVKLERFIVERYARSAADRAAGRDAPVREYRSRVTITEPGREPYVLNILVNRPGRVRGYYIYQMSWGQSADRFGRPLMYTVLQFSRDPGLPFVYAGFVVTLAGTLLFALRVVRARTPREGAA